MPTLIYIGKIRVQIFPQDHNPPHVHVIGPDCEAKFAIETLECSSVRGFTKRDIRRIQVYLTKHKNYLMEAWHDYQKE